MRDERFIAFTFLIGVIIGMFVTAPYGWYTLAICIPLFLFWSILLFAYMRESI